MASDHATDPGNFNAEDDMELCSPPTTTDASQEIGPKRRADSLFVPEQTTEHKRPKLEDDDSCSFTQEEASAEMSTDGMTSHRSDLMSDLTSTQNTGITVPPPAPIAVMYPPAEQQRTAPTPKIVDGRMMPYDAFAIEGRPRLSVFHPSFTEAEKGVTKLLRAFITTCCELQQDGYANGEIDDVVFKIQRYRSPQANYPDVRPVAFFGPAGAGKSSGIVCYLSQLGTAVESDSGARGTSVIHEYCDARPGQMHKFLVVVRYSPPRSIAKDIGRHCQLVFEYLKISSNTELDEEEITLLRDRYDTAIAYFVTLLCDDDDFESKEDAGEYFRERKSENEHEVADHLFNSIQTLLDTRGIADSNYEEAYPAENTAQLNEVFDNISGSAGPNGRAKSSLWPLVSKIEVHLDNDLLKTGVVLADLPGVSDTNETVVSSTQKYLSSAGTILVFSTPDRCRNSPILDPNLSECIRLNKTHQTILVITKIDNKAPYSDAEKKKLLPEDAEELESAERQVRKCKQELEQAGRKAATATDFEGLRDASKRTQEAELTLKAAEAMVKQVTINIRNRDLARYLKNKFRELSGQKSACDLKVLFTSNAAYQQHLVGFDPKEPPILDVDATGIPVVREVLYKTTAQGKHHALCKIIRDRLPSLFNSIVEVLTRSRLERKQDVEQLIKKVLNEDENIVRSIAVELDRVFKHTVLRTFKDNNTKWQDAADALLNKWASLAAVSFGAFCRRAGDFKPKNGTKANWTFDIRNIFQLKANAAFDELDETISMIEKHTLSEIHDLYLKLEHELEGHDAFQGITDKNFVRSIRTIQEMASKDMAARFDVFRGRINLLRSSATLNIVGDSDSYATVAMREAFEAAAAAVLPSANTNAPPVLIPGRNGKLKKRGGTHAARVHEFCKRFTATGGATGIFVAISKAMADDFDTTLREWAEGTEKKLCRASHAVLHKFNTKFGTDTMEVKMEEDDANHVQMLKYECDKAIGTLQGDLENLLLECEEYEKSA